MGQYRKKPIVIEARQTGIDYDEDCSIMGWCGGQFGWSSPEDEDDLDYLFLIHTLEGDLKVTSGDYVICGVQGEFYPCKPDIFDATYELA